MEAFIIIFACVIIFLFCLLLFLIAPRLKKKSYVSPEVGYAHRGLWNGDRPENSMSAFAAAVDHGYGIETDVRLTKDGVAVLFHDDTLLRVCGDERRVIDCTYDELLSLGLSGTDEKIPTLSELLELAGGKVPLLIELKGEDLGTALCDTVAPMLDPLGDMAVVESFNPILLYKMRKLRPGIARGQLVTNLVAQHYPGNALRNLALSSMLFNFLSRPDFIAYDKNFPRALSVNLCIKLFGAGACIWTIHGQSELDSLKGKNVCPIFEEH